MVRSPGSRTFPLADFGKPRTEGVEGLDPQLDAPVDSGPKRTMTPIGAPSSPVASTAVNYDVGVIGGGGPRKIYVSPLASSLPGYSIAECQLRNWAWETDPDVMEPIENVSTHPPNRSVAEATADDVLNESLESLQLDPQIVSSSSSRVPNITLPAKNQVFHNTVASPYEQQHILDRNLYPNEGRTHSVQSPSTPQRDLVPRSRSILVRNLPPGVDDDSLRTLLGSFGPLRDLGAQQRLRGGRGSVVATYYDLRDACNAHSSLDGTFHFGRRIDVRFHSPIHTIPRSPLQPQNGPDSSETVSPRRVINGKRVGDGSNFGSTYLSGDKSATLPSPSNHGTLVVFNLDPNTTAEEIRGLFGSIGDVKEIRSTPNKRHHKFVEFFDVRDAERALVALNKTEVGGKKIKIEISRPGGRGSHNARNNSGSNSNSNRYEESRQTTNRPSTTHQQYSNGNGGQQQYSDGNSRPKQYSNIRTPPSMPVMGYSTAGDKARSDPILAFSPVEGAAISPYSASFASNDGNRHRSGGLPSIDVGNTLPRDRQSFNSASNVHPVSPSTDFYNSVRNHQLSPYSLTDLPDSSNSQIGSSYGGNDYTNFESLSRVATGVDKGQLRSANTWPNYPHVFSTSPEGVRRAIPDSGGIPINGAVTEYMPHAYIGDSRYMAQSAPRENAFELQARADVAEFRRNTSYSPRSFRAMSSRSREFSRISDVGASSVGVLHDGYPAVGATSPDEPSHSLRATVRRLPETGRTSTSKEFVTTTSTKETQPPPRQTYSAVLRSSGQEAAARRANFIATRNSHSAVSANISHASSNNGNSKNLLDISKVISGEDTRTALMIRNIPNKYNQRMLLAALDEKHRGHFDFMYLPIDFKNKCNVGYAFINFTSTEHIPDFYNQFHGHKWGRFNSEKVCEICYARIQGKNSLIAHFQNSSLMHEDPKCRPVILSNGKPEEFPVGSNVRTRRGPSVRDSHRLSHEPSPSFSPVKHRGRCH